MLLPAFLKTFSTTVAIVLVVSSTIHAQDSTLPATQDNPAPKESNTGVYTGREIFVPATPVQKEPEPAARTFSDGFLRKTGQHLGFSLGVSGVYSPDASEQGTALSTAAIAPELYLNFEKRKFALRLTYGAAKRYFKGRSEMNAVSQNGTLSFGYTTSLGRKTTLQL